MEQNLPHWKKNEKSFLEYVYSIPEFSFYSGSVQASPSGHQNTQRTSEAISDAEKEKLRTAGALLALNWILNDSYERFVCSQSAPNRLTRHQWQQMKTWTGNVCNSSELIHAMIIQMALHDLGKIDSFAERVSNRCANSTALSSDHDEILFIAMEKVHKNTKDYADLLPSFALLDGKYRELILSGWRTKLNVGQLMQAETVSCCLSAVRSLSLEVLDFFLLHTLLDIAGVCGHITLEGSPVITNSTWEVFEMTRDSLRSLSKSGITTLDCYRDLMKRRFERFRQLLSHNDVNDRHSEEEEFALTRLLCMVRAQEDSSRAAKLLAAWQSLSSADRSRLTCELNYMGEPQSDRSLRSETSTAIVLYYAPQTLVNAMSLDRVKQALLNFLGIFQKARYRTEGDDMFDILVQPKSDTEAELLILPSSSHHSK